MLKWSRDTAEYYTAELPSYVLEANDDVNYVLRAKQASALRDVACSQLSYLHAYLIEALSSYETGSGVHVTMMFSKATRLFSRWSNSGKSSSSSCDSRAVSSASARKSLACEAVPKAGGDTGK